jgi:hypothetical protein
VGGGVARRVVWWLCSVDTALSTAVDGRILVFVTSSSGIRRDTILLVIAVGAQPGRRRSLVAFQALLVGGLGGLLGVAVGTFVAFTARAMTGSPDFVVPWWNLVAAGLGAPALCTRGRLPVVRRGERSPGAGNALGPRGADALGTLFFCEVLAGASGALAIARTLSAKEGGRGLCGSARTPVRRGAARTTDPGVATGCLPLNDAVRSQRRR